MRRHAGLAAVLLLQSAQVVAFELVESEWFVRLVYGLGTDAMVNEESSIMLAPRYGFRIGGSMWLQTSARLRLDAADMLEPGKPAFDSYTDASRPWAFSDYGTLELRDLYLDIPLGPGLLRLGKQQIVWGNLDGIRVLDQMDPVSFREFILADFDESRISLWSVYLDSRLGNWQLEMVWTPDTTTYDIPEPGAWLQFEAPRFRYGAPPDAPLPDLTTRLPVSMIDDANYGLRLSRQLGGFDLSLQAQSGLDYEPLGELELTADGVSLVQFYQRREIYGLAFQRALAGLVIRGEFAAQPGRTFNLRNGNRLETDEADQWTAALGLDIDGPFNTFINAQFIYDKVSNAPDGLVRPATDRIATIFMRRNFAYDSIRAELRWYGEIDADSGLGRGSVSWLITDAISLSVNAAFFYGDPDGIFGQFRDRDRVSVALELTL